MEPIEDEFEFERPRTRGECGQERPCPWISCIYHLYVDVTKAGTLHLNFPEQEPWEITQSCALDVASQGGLTDEEVGAALNVTRQRIQQIEAGALGRVKVRLPLLLDI